MTNSNDIRPVWTNDAATMAEDTAKRRWPKTIQNLVEEVENASSGSAGGKREEGVAISERLRQLKAEVEDDRLLTPLNQDGGDDIDLYNHQLSELGHVTWRAAPWLYAECYLYRRVQTLFAGSVHWRGFDIFKTQKDSAFANSRVAVDELAGRYMQVVQSGLSKNDDEDDKERRRLLFEEMTQIALWGNATDLSLLTNLSLDDMGALQGTKAIEKNRRNVIANDTETVYRYLSGSPFSSNRRVDIVLDNAGFEFFTDLIYASYLLRSSIASQVVLHTKSFPWFVSDVTPSDVSTVLDDLERADIFPGRSSLDPLCRLLRDHFSNGEITVQDHPFWTTASSFQDLPTQAPDLFTFLSQSALVIFKGDLNYRKLTNDGLWPYTTPFKTALGAVGSGSSLRALALRTNKSDVCVGVSDEAKVEQLNKEAPELAWVRNGKYAVISFSDGV